MSKDIEAEGRPGWSDWGLLLVVSALVMAVVAWPRQVAHREDPWRTVLAGVQSGGQNEGYVAGERALVHFHDLDGRAGRVIVVLAARLDGSHVEVDLSAHARTVKARIGPGPTPVEFAFPSGTRDLDLEVVSRVSSAGERGPATARPLRIVSVVLDRDPNVETLLRALLPLLAGLWAFLTTRSHGRGFALLFSSAVTAATGAAVIAAFDPVCLALAPTFVSRGVPLAFVAIFAALAIHRPSAGIVAVCLGGITLALHVNVVHFGFIYDDRLWARPWGLGEILGTFVGAQDPLGVSNQQYRPIPSLSHALDHALWGANAAMFHTINLAWLQASLFALFQLLRRLRIPDAPAALGAIVCAVHPLAASTVGWISERTDTLAGTFMLGALIVLLGRRGTRLAWVLLPALLALWSKETAVMLPVLAALLMWAALENDEVRARRRSLAGLGLLVVCYVGIWVAILPEKAVLRLSAEAPARAGVILLGTNLYAQMFDPIGFEAWRRIRSTAEPSLWWLAAPVLGAFLLAAHGSVASARPRLTRVAAAGLLWALMSMLPFKGHHDDVDLYRLGHTPLLGLGIFVAALSAVRFAGKPWALCAIGLVATLRFAPEARTTSAAWGYPGFMFRDTIAFNLENEAFKHALPLAMRENLELEGEMAAHLDAPLEAPWPGVVRVRGKMARRAPRSAGP